MFLVSAKVLNQTWQKRDFIRGWKNTVYGTKNWFSPGPNWPFSSLGTGEYSITKVTDRYVVPNDDFPLRRPTFQSKMGSLSRNPTLGHSKSCSKFRPNFRHFFKNANFWSVTSFKVVSQYSNTSSGQAFLLEPTYDKKSSLISINQDYDF